MIGWRKKVQILFLSRLRQILPRGHNIALLDWGGQGAFGDDLLRECVKNVLYEEAAQRGWTIKFTSESWCDLLVIGGGSLLGFDTMDLYARTTLVPAPFVVFGTGFRRERRALSEVQRLRLKTLLGRACLKGVRGYVSQQFLIHNEIDDVEVIGDPAWLFDPVPVADFAPGFRLGVVVRSMGKTNEPQYLDNRRMYQIIADVADALIERFDAQAYFFSLAENVHDSDTEGARNTIALMKHSDRAKIIPMDRDPFVTASLIGKMDYLISQRLHPTVVAWVQGKPCVALEYQFGKTTDCMNSIGMDEFVIRTDEFSLDLYLTKFNRLWAEREIVAQQAQRSISYWRCRLRDFAKRTLDLLDSKSQRGVYGKPL